MSPNTLTTGTILDRIVATQRAELSKRMRVLPVPLLRQISDAVSAAQGKQVSLIERIQGGRTSTPKVIAEHKKASPSKGDFGLKLSVESLGLAYHAGGAVGYSVLTERVHFGGHLYDLARAREHLNFLLPGENRPAILRKDFIFDHYQIVESRAYGADAILLIAAILEESQLRDLLQHARELHTEALVEIHDEEQIHKALRADARLIGINNRDLRTFDVDLATTERLRPYIPGEYTVVSESGIHTHSDVMRLAACGIHAILVGEALVKSDDIPAKIRELLHGS